MSSAVVAPVSCAMQRDGDDDLTARAPCTQLLSSWLCDCFGMACALPCVAFGPCLQVGPYSHRRMPSAPSGSSSRGLTDRWYRAAIHTMHGGSFLQLLATQAFWWRFPRVHKVGRTYVHEIHVASRNCCGDLAAPLIEATSPRFRIREVRAGIWSVRLTVLVCGVEQTLSGRALNDVWVLTHGGRIIHSMKTRGHSTAWNVTTSCATGPAIFVEAADEPSFDDIDRALRLAM